MKNYFESPFKGKIIQDQITNPNIKAGKYSYYSGYYHGHSFDECARFLMPDNEQVDQLVIGSFCSIGSGASFIMAGNQGHRHDWISTFPFHYMPEVATFSGSLDGFAPAGDTVVGHDVWIGTEAMIMPGVKIGHGAVIGSRALISRDVEPYAIMGGNPAKLIRKRFEESAIQQLLEMNWWDWPEPILQQAMPILCSGNIAKLYQFYQDNLQRSKA